MDRRDDCILHMHTEHVDSRSLGHFEFLSDANCRGRARGVATISSEEMSAWPGRVAQNCRRQMRTFGEFVALAYPESEPAHFDQVHERRRG
jgi:hypothetical protein